MRNQVTKLCIIAYFLNTAISLNAPVDVKPVEVSTHSLSVVWRTLDGDAKEFFATITPLDDGESTKQIKYINESFTTWVDLMPGKNYTISIVAIGHDGSFSQPAVVAVTTVPMPPFGVRVSKFVNPVLSEYSVKGNRTMLFPVYGAVIMWDGPDTGYFDGFHVKVSPPDGIIRLPIQLKAGEPSPQLKQKRRIIWDLLPGVYYDVTVQTISNGRFSDGASSGERMTPEVPASINTDEISPTEVTLSWNQPHRGILDGYILEFDPIEGTVIDPENLTEKRRTIQDLTPGTRYNIDIYSTSFGLLSYQPRSGQIKTPPATPIGPVISSNTTSSSVIIDWKRPPGRLDYYEVVFYPTLRDYGRLRHRIYDAAVKLTKLEADTEYSLIVYAVSNGVYSKPLQDKTITSPVTATTEDNKKAVANPELEEKATQSPPLEFTSIEKFLDSLKTDGVYSTVLPTTNMKESEEETTQQMFKPGPGTLPGHQSISYIASTLQPLPNTNYLEGIVTTNQYQEKMEETSAELNAAYTVINTVSNKSVDEGVSNQDKLMPTTSSFPTSTTVSSSTNTLATLSKDRNEFLELTVKTDTDQVVTGSRYGEYQTKPDPPSIYPGAFTLEYPLAQSTSTTSHLSTTSTPHGINETDNFTGSTPVSQSNFEIFIIAEQERQTIVNENVTFYVEIPKINISSFTEYQPPVIDGFMIIEDVTTASYPVPEIANSTTTSEIKASTATSSLQPEITDVESKPSTTTEKSMTETREATSKRVTTTRYTDTPLEITTTNSHSTTQKTDVAEEVATVFTTSTMDDTTAEITSIIPDQRSHITKKALNTTPIIEIVTETKDSETPGETMVTTGLPQNGLNKTTSTGFITTSNTLTASSDFTSTVSENDATTTKVMELTSSGRPLENDALSTTVSTYKTTPSTPKLTHPSKVTTQFSFDERTQAYSNPNKLVNNTTNQVKTLPLEVATTKSMSIKTIQTTAGNVLSESETNPTSLPYTTRENTVTDFETDQGTTASTFTEYDKLKTTQYFEPSEIMLTTTDENIVTYTDGSYKTYEPVHSTKPFQDWSTKATVESSEPITIKDEYDFESTTADQIPTEKFENVNWTNPKDEKTTASNSIVITSTYYKESTSNSDSIQTTTNGAESSFTEENVIATSVASSTAKATNSNVSHKPVTATEATSDDGLTTNGGSVITIENENELIPIKSGFTTMCKPNNITVLIDKSVIGKYEKLYGPLHLNQVGNPACRGIEYETYYRYTIAPNLLDCGTQIELNETHVNFTNSVSNTRNKTTLLGSLFDDSGMVMLGNRVPEVRKQFIHMKIWCTFPLDLNVTTTYPFLPQITMQVLTFNISGRGEFSAVMQLYKNDDYLEPYISPPTINGNDSLYVGISLLDVEDGSSTYTVVKKCWGTPERNPLHEQQYPIIDDYCPITGNLDGTIKIHGNGKGRKVRWEGAVFKFVSYHQVWLHCEIKVCFGENCQPECVNNRRRRAVDGDIKLHILSTGPIVMRNDAVVAVHPTTPKPAIGDPQEPEVVFNETIVLALIITLTVVILASVLLIVCVFVRRKRARRSHKSIEEIISSSSSSSSSSQPYEVRSIPLKDSGENSCQVSRSSSNMTTFSTRKSQKNLHVQAASTSYVANNLGKDQQQISNPSKFSLSNATKQVYDNEAFTYPPTDFMNGEQRTNKRSLTLVPIKVASSAVMNEGVGGQYQQIA